MKKRLDCVIQELYPQYSRVQIQSWIMQGKVTVDKVIVTKSGTAVRDDAVCVLTVEEPKYVSRAGFKLEKALEHFNINVAGLVVLDAGLSTGGFTDCLLQNGAATIYGVDVGQAQVHNKISSDPRVVVMEKTNLRHLESLPTTMCHPELVSGSSGARRSFTRSLGPILVDLVTLDLSFISVLKVMPAVINLMQSHAQLLVLIKPQFEAEREDVGKGGIIKDPLVHQRVIDKMIHGLGILGFECQGVTESPITGTTGNKEFLGYFKRKV